MAVTTTGQAGVERVPAPYRLSIEAAGLFALLVGAWGGIVAFVGPIIGFSGDGSASWVWNRAHALLFLAPGAAACFAGLVIMIEALSYGRARRSLLTFGGMLAVVCGAWFIVGPLAWPALVGGSVFVSASPLRELAHWLGYSFGPGGVLLMLGSFILGRPRTSAVAIPARAPRHLSQESDLPLS